MMHGDVYCEHCEMQADLCDCGADYEMSYRPQPVEFPQSQGCFYGLMLLLRIAINLVVGLVMLYWAFWS